VETLIEGGKARLRSTSNAELRDSWAAAGEPGNLCPPACGPMPTAIAPSGRIIPQFRRKSIIRFIRLGSPAMKNCIQTKVRTPSTSAVLSQVRPPFDITPLACFRGADHNQVDGGKWLCASSVSLEVRAVSKRDQGPVRPGVHPVAPCHAPYKAVLDAVITTASAIYRSSARALSFRAFVEAGTIPKRRWNGCPGVVLRGTPCGLAAAAHNGLSTRGSVFKAAGKTSTLSRGLPTQSVRRLREGGVSRDAADHQLILRRSLWYPAPRKWDKDLIDNPPNSARFAFPFRHAHRLLTLESPIPGILGRQTV